MFRRSVGYTLGITNDMESNQFLMPLLKQVDAIPRAQLLQLP